MSTAIYAGSFDPFTNGHLSVVLLGASMFSHVRILLAVNPDKKYLLSLEKRLKIIKNHISPIPNVSVDWTNGYVVHYARKCGAKYLLRGIRNETDAKYELLVSEENLKLAPEIQTVLLPSNPDISDISSSKVKSIILENTREKSLEKSLGTLVPKYVDFYTWESIVDAQTTLRKRGK